MTDSGAAKLSATHVTEALRRTGLGRTLFYQLVREGHFDVRKIGRRTVVMEASIDQFLEKLPRLHGSAR